MIYLNILITGANGSIGSYLKDYFEKDHKIYALGKNELDVTNKTLVCSTIELLKPDLVIHTAAITNLDFCENNETAAYTVNTIGSLNVAYACSCLDIPIVYISTNYVYNGLKRSPYYETDECDPLNIYGKTKLAGEKLIRTICKKYFIIRTSWVFGGYDCYIKKALDKRESPIFVCSNEVVSPTYIRDLAEAINTMVKSNFYGVYNCSNNAIISKCNLIRTVFYKLGLEKNLIEMPEGYIANSAPRPKYSALNTSLLKNCFNIELPSLESRINEYISEYNN